MIQHQGQVFRNGVTGSGDIARKAIKCVCVTEMTSSLVADGVIVCRQRKRPTLDSGRGHGWNSIGFIKKRLQWLMIRSRNGVPVGNGGTF